MLQKNILTFKIIDKFILSLYYWDFLILYNRELIIMLFFYFLYLIAVF